jgi:hypothetical protein
MEIQDIIQGLTSAEIAAITSPEANTLIVNTTLQQAVIYVNGTFKQASFENTDDIPEGTKKFSTSADLAQITTNTSDISTLQANSFDKTTDDASDINMQSSAQTVQNKIAAMQNEIDTNTASITTNTSEILDLDNDKRDLTAQKNSIENDSGDLQLVNDETTPTANKYYGTDSSGNKGFHDMPYIKENLVITNVSSNFNSNVPTDIPDMTYTVSGLSGARDFIFYATVLTNNDQNEELDFYIAKNGTTDTNQVIIETQRKNQDQSIQGTFELDGLVNGDVITFQFDTRSDNVDIETRRMIIQSWK